MTGATVLRCGQGHLATKRWIVEKGKPRAIGYNAGTWFSASRVEVGDIHELSALLTRLEREPMALIIRGEPLPGSNLRRVRRLKHRKKAGTNNEIGPFFQESKGGLPWMLIDFDKIEVMHQHIDPVEDPEGAVEHLVGLLPDYFRDVTYHWQLSASTGMGGPGVLSAHAWFWLDRNVTEAELTAWAEALDVHIDVSMFRTVQPHYTAAPIFEGVRDPLPRRSGLRVGLAHEVTLPTNDLIRRKRAGASREGISGLSGSRGFAAKIAVLGDGPGLCGFHGPLRDATASYVYEHGEHINPEALKAELRDRIDEAPKSLHRSQEDIDRYAGDQYLDELIDGALEKLSDWSLERAERETEGAAAAIAPHWPAAALPLRDAVDELDHVIAKFFDRVAAGDKPHVGVKAAAGLGKTAACICALAALPNAQDLNIEVYVPDHKLAVEWAGRLGGADSHLRVQVIQGRGYEDRDGALCARADIAEAVAKAELRVMETICESKAGGGSEVERCPYFEPCSNNRYLSQFADKSPAIRIMPMAYLSLPRGKTVPKPDLVIVDERFFQEAISRRDLGLDRLTAVAGDPHRGRYPLKTAISLLNVNLAVNSIIRDALTEGRPLLAALREAGHTAETLDNQVCSMLAAVQNLDISPALSDAEIRTKIASAERGEILTRASLLAILRDEIDTGRAEAHGVELRRNVPTKNGERQDRVYLHRRNPLLRLSDLPVLLLDADLDREIVSKLVPDLDIVEIGVERRAEIIQVHNTRCSKRRLLGTNRVGDQKCAAARVDEIRKLAISAAALGQRVLVVTYKPVRRLLTGEDSMGKLPPGAPLKNSNSLVEVAHFGAIRGQDRWRDFDTVIVAGRHQMPVGEAEALARALYYDRDEPLIFLRPDENDNKLMAQEWRGYRMRDEQHAYAKVEAHPDHDVQALIEQHREAEMAQAVDRIRLVHNEKLKRVIILSNVPLDMTVDRLVRWQDIIPSRLKLVALTAQAVPLSARELTRCFPEIWRTAKAVEGELRRAGLTPLGILKNIY